MRWLDLAALIAVSAAAGNAATPSFDCGKAATPVEKLICSDSGLAAADGKLAAAFGKLIAENPGYSDSLRTEQRYWMKERSVCMTDKVRAKQISCLREQYRLRQEVFEGETFIVCAKPALKGAVFAMACIAPNTPEKLTLTLAGTKAEMAELKELHVSGRGLAPQSIKLNGQYYFENLSDSLLELLDVNFDGHPDLKVAVSTSAGPNSEFAWWLYDARTGKFVASTLGEQLSGFEIWTDPKTRSVWANARQGCCAWSSSSYVWKGASLRLTSTVDTGEFSASALPGLKKLQDMMCGTLTTHFNDAGLITRADFDLDAAPDSQCDKEALAGSGKMQDTIRRAAKNFHIEAKSKLNFAVVYDIPQKPAY
jgi:uncharacterized protein YecT (DUF1311 family)